MANYNSGWLSKRGSCSENAVSKSSEFAMYLQSFSGFRANLERRYKQKRALHSAA